MSTTLLRNRMEQQSKISKIKTRRSIFPARWSRKQTMNASYLVPIMCKKVVPGESLYINLSALVRLNTQVVCPIDNLQVETFFFYEPERVVWENHPYFIGAIKDPNNITNYLTPQIEITADKNTAGSLFNYLSGARLGKKVKVSSIPFRIHNDIYNEYFRDSDCESPKKVNRTDSDDSIDDFDLYRIHKSRDYFTNSTRDIQKGEDITIPIGTTAPVIGNGMALGLKGAGTSINQNYLGSYIISGNNNRYFASTGQAQNNEIGTQQTSDNNFNGDHQNIGVSTDPEYSGLIADLRNAIGPTIDAFREALMTKEYLEALNRGGTKYTDIMNNIYGVTIPDLTIQRPVYLGGTSTPLFTQEVIQTSATGQTGSDTPQGNIAGYGKTGDGGRIINASFQEFGYVIGYAVIKAQPQYQQGLDRQWTESERYDYFNPYYINLSDQVITRGEIYLEDYDLTDNETGEILNNKTFGYIGRYDNQRYFKNQIAGELNSEYQYTLDVWHYAEKFENAPENNADFMHDKTYEILDRSMAVRYEDEQQEIKAPQFICDFAFSGAVALPIPTHAVPKISALI